MLKQTFINQINDIEVTFQAEWFSDNGERWRFSVLISVEGEEPRQNCDIKTSTPSINELADALADLDEPNFPSEIKPQPQIGYVSILTLNDICAQLRRTAIETAPQYSAYGSYYGC